MQIAGRSIFVKACVLVATACTAPAQSAKALHSTDLRNTIITPVLDVEIPAGKNLVYCAGFQLAWDELRRELKTSLPDAPTVVRALDERLVGKPDVPEAACFAVGGIGGDLPDKIRTGVQKKFGAAAPPLDDLDTTLVAYALLLRNLQFPQEFVLQETLLNFSANDTQFSVAAFGIDPDRGSGAAQAKLREQVLVVDCDPEGREFVVRLRSQWLEDEIILAKIPPEKSLLQTIASVSARIEKSKPAPLAAEDVLTIPRVEFEIRHVFPEISRHVGAVSGGPGLALQQIHFTLGEKGIAPKSEARTHAPAIPRRLIFDQPFLLWLRKTGSRYPYLTLWVGHPEILQAADNPPKAAFPKPAASAPPAKSTLDGKALVAARCVGCHTLSKVYSAKHTHAEWTATVKRMVGRGAKLTAAERQAVVDYLSSR